MELLVSSECSCHSLEWGHQHTHKYKLSRICRNLRHKFNSVHQTVIRRLFKCLMVVIGYNVIASSAFASPFSLINSSQLFNDINPENAPILFPVTKGLPCNSYDLVMTTAPLLAKTYEDALTETQELATEADTEDFSGLMLITSLSNQTMIGIIQQLRLIRTQLAILTKIEVIDKLHQLDNQVRPLLPREGAGC